METPSETKTAPSEVRAPVRGLAVASVSLGFFSMCVFWWIPFGFLLGAAGFTVGLLCNVAGVRGGEKGDNLALLGMGLSAFGLMASFTLFIGVQKMMWDN